MKNYIKILALDYYDGPERGLIVFPKGRLARFSAIADSKSNLFRSYEIAGLAGFWQGQIKALPITTFYPSRGGVLIAREKNADLESLEASVFGAEIVQCYLGISHIAMGCISVVSMIFDDLEGIRQLGASSGAFNSAHMLLKQRRREVEIWDSGEIWDFRTLRQGRQSQLR
jgi:hypothetical protein